MPENEKDDWTRADEILGADYTVPAYRWYVEAWEKHPERALLDERKGEVDEDGMPKWHTVREHDLDEALVAYWQRPVDSDDAREPICVCAWPKKREDDARADDQAVVDEYGDVPPLGGPS